VLCVFGNARRTGVVQGYTTSFLILEDYGLTYHRPSVNGIYFVAVAIAILGLDNEDLLSNLNHSSSPVYRDGQLL